MKYDLTTKSDITAFKFKVDYLIEKEKKVNLAAIHEARSVKQNSYVHVAITLFAIEYGYTLNEAKTLLKRECTFMYYEKNHMMFLKSTSVLNSKEMTDFIEFIRNYAGQQGLYIPSPLEYLENKFTIDRQIESNKTFL